MVLLVVCYTGIGVTHPDAPRRTTPTRACEAYAAGTDDASVRYTVVPPKAICTWDVDGEPTEVVVAVRVGPRCSRAGAVLAVGGVLACGRAGVAPWLR